ncbi:MAG TPA: hypothetical protein VGH23_16355 [Rhizomicrobium sp.]|jgi:hypothetical protein
MDLRNIPIPEIIDAEILAALNKPGLSHIRSKVETCEGDGYVSGKIDYFIAGSHCGVTLIINSDMSYLLMKPDDPKSIWWTAEEAQPEPITAALVEALSSRVRAAA